MPLTATPSRASTPAQRADAEQRITIPGVTWKEYLLLNDAIDTPGVRMAYCDGRLEIMTTSNRHEWLKTSIARLIETWATERDLPLHGYGQTTFRAEARARGAEPDECWCVSGPLREYPEIVLEVVLTHGGLDKLELYLGMGIGEVWFWLEGKFQLYRLAGAAYRAQDRSRLLPDIDFDLLAELIQLEDQVAAIRALRDRLRGTVRARRAATRKR